MLISSEENGLHRDIPVFVEVVDSSDTPDPWQSINSIIGTDDNIGNAMMRM